METREIFDNLRDISARFASERTERQLRRGLVKADFDQLKRAGFLLTGVPVELGGVWESSARSTRPVCEMLRILAQGDASVALVCSMHPSLLAFWLATHQVPQPFQQAWDEQRRYVFQTALEGAWWATITSEPGSGGDVANTKMLAQPGADNARAC